MSVKVLELAKCDDWKKDNRGFRRGKSMVVWTHAHLEFSKDRKKVRLSRIEFEREYRQYVDPHTPVELVKK